MILSEVDIFSRFVFLSRLVSYCLLNGSMLTSETDITGSSNAQKKYNVRITC